MVAAITPFNASVNLMLQKVAPALAVGNAVVVKPAPEAAVVAPSWPRRSTVPCRQACCRSCPAVRRLRLPS